MPLMAGSPLGLPFISQVYFPGFIFQLHFLVCLCCTHFRKLPQTLCGMIQDDHKAGTFWLFELVLERLWLQTVLSSPLPTPCTGRGRRGWHHICFPLVLCNGFEVLWLTDDIIGRMTGGGISLWRHSQCSADKLNSFKTWSNPDFQTLQGK